MPNRAVAGISDRYASAKSGLGRIGGKRILLAMLPSPVRRWIVVIRRVRAGYRLAHGRMPRLLWPRRYSEKMQWRKLFEHDPLFAVFCDKLGTRDHIARHVGADLLVELLWSGDDPEDIPFACLQPPYVLKSSHASGHIAMVPTHAAVDASKLRQQARGWLAECQATQALEPGYRTVAHRIMVERMLCDADGSRPIERRFFVFDGRVRLIQTNATAEDGIMRHGAFHTPQWQRQPWRLLSPMNSATFAPPPMLDRMIVIAEQLGVGLPHLRVDFYEHDATLKIGELTVYSWSGLIPFTPPEADLLVGGYWRIRHPALRALWAMATRLPVCVDDQEASRRRSQ